MVGGEMGGQPGLHEGCPSAKGLSCLELPALPRLCGACRPLSTPQPDRLPRRHPLFACLALQVPADGWLQIRSRLLVVPGRPHPVPRSVLRAPDALHRAAAACHAGQRHAWVSPGAQAPAPRFGRGGGEGRGGEASSSRWWGSSGGSSSSSRRGSSGGRRRRGGSGTRGGSGKQPGGPAARGGAAGGGGAWRRGPAGRRQRRHGGSRRALPHSLHHHRPCGGLWLTSCCGMRSSPPSQLCLEPACQENALACWQACPLSSDPPLIVAATFCNRNRQQRLTRRRQAEASTSRGRRPASGRTHKPGVAVWDTAASAGRAASVGQDYDAFSTLLPLRADDQRAAVTKARRRHVPSCDGKRASCRRRACQGSLGSLSRPIFAFPCPSASCLGPRAPPASRPSVEADRRSRNGERSRQREGVRQEQRAVSGWPRGARGCGRHWGLARSDAASPRLCARRLVKRCQKPDRVRTGGTIVRAGSSFLGRLAARRWLPAACEKDAVGQPKGSGARLQRLRQRRCRLSPLGRAHERRVFERRAACRSTVGAAWSELA